MKRYLLLFLLAWGLLGVPALCMAGSLLHDCECGAEIACAHEDECVDDPCMDLQALPGTDPDAGPGALPESWAPPVRDSAAGPLPDPVEPLARPNLPFPDDQRPLLI